MTALLQEDLQAGEEIATCPSCSLVITVIYNPEDFPPADSAVSITDASHAVAVS
jgi:diphthamide biosynthesis protein 3